MTGAHWRMAKSLPLSISAQFCKDAYLEIVKTDEGRIAWAYLKPLLLGKIPYAPDTPVTRAIMNKVSLMVCPPILWFPLSDHFTNWFQATQVLNDLEDMNTLSRSMVDGIYGLADLANYTASNTDTIKVSLPHLQLISSLESSCGLLCRRLCGAPWWQMLWPACLALTPKRCSLTSRD